MNKLDSITPASGLSAPAGRTSSTSSPVTHASPGSKRPGPRDNRLTTETLSSLLAHRFSNENLHKMWNEALCREVPCAPWEASVRRCLHEFQASMGRDRAKFDALREAVLTYTLIKMTDDRRLFRLPSTRRAMPGEVMRLRNELYTACTIYKQHGFLHEHFPALLDAVQAFSDIAPDAWHEPWSDVPNEGTAAEDRSETESLDAAGATSVPDENRNPPSYGVTHLSSALSTRLVASPGCSEVPPPAAGSGAHTPSARLRKLLNRVEHPGIVWSFPSATFEPAKIPLKLLKRYLASLPLHAGRSEREHALTELAALIRRGLHVADSWQAQRLIARYLAPANLPGHRYHLPPVLNQTPAPSPTEIVSEKARVDTLMTLLASVDRLGKEFATMAVRIALNNYRDAAKTPTPREAARLLGAMLETLDRVQVVGAVQMPWIPADLRQTIISLALRDIPALYHGMEDRMHEADEATLDILYTLEPGLKAARLFDPRLYRIHRTVAQFSLPAL